MTSTNNPEAPIYDSLIEEHGDVVAEARSVAEETQREATEKLHFGGSGPLPSPGTAE